MSSIVLSHVSFSWPDDTPVFTDLSFSVGPGRTGLVAPNGAGKSTLLALVAGELTPRRGHDHRRRHRRLPAPDAAAAR